MKRIASLLIVLIYTIQSSFGQNLFRQDLENIATIDFPSKPGVIDTLDKKIFSFYNENDNYRVIVSNYQKNNQFVLKEGKLDEFYNGAINGILKSSKGKLITKKEIVVEGLRAIEVEFTSILNPGFETSGYLRLFYSNKGIITMVFSTPSPVNTSTLEERNKFFDSFQITIDKKYLLQYTIAKADAYDISFALGEIFGYILMPVFFIWLFRYFIRSIRR